ncbi:MAG: TonB-dependent receptor domain-containing protein, partial [Burkholderiales bacterium]
ATVAFIRILSPTVINEARFNVTRFYSNQLEASSDVDYSIPRVEVEGFLPGGARIRFGAPRGETSPAIFAQNTYEFRDTLTWVRGNQAWKFGAEIRREQDNNNLLGGARPTFSFLGLFNLANDAPLFEAINTDPITGRANDLQRYLRIQAYGFFFQDDWKARPNLTLNLGLRYEYYTPPKETQGRITNFVLGPNFLRDARVEIRDQLYESDRNNFAPRLGFAYSPSWFGVTRDRVVVRGGFGIAYNRTPTVSYSNIRGNPPFFARNSPCCGSAVEDINIPAGRLGPFAPLGGNQANPPRILYTTGSGSIFGFPTAAGLRLGINPLTNQVIGSDVEVYGTTPELPNAYLYNYSLEAQAELPFSLTGTLGYQGSAGRKFIRIVPYRFIYPSTGNPPLPFGPTFI